MGEQVLLQALLVGLSSRLAQPLFLFLLEMFFGATLTALTRRREEASGLLQWDAHSCRILAKTASVAVIRCMGSMLAHVLHDGTCLTVGTPHGAEVTVHSASEFLAITRPCLPLI